MNIDLPFRSKPSKKLSKKEKICELECELKLAAEENRRLRKRMWEMRNGDDPQTRGGSSVNSRDFDLDRMKDVMKALKRVSLSQEKNIHALREKASGRREELEQRDTVIAFLRKEIQSLQWVETELQSMGNGSDPRKTLCALQKAFLEEKNKNAELVDILDESEAEVGRLKEVTELSVSDLSLQSKQSRRSSAGSYSPYSQFDVARLKDDIADKNYRIEDLENELDMIKEELYEERRSKKTVQFSPSLHSDKGNGSSTASETSDEYFEDAKALSAGFVPDSFDLDSMAGNDYTEGEDDTGSW